MWVEIDYDYKNNYYSKVILFVRMWVEITPMGNRSFRSDRHPLREDVSWNIEWQTNRLIYGSHPLREDVSWNVKSGCSYTARVVILFVRMWVEILLTPLFYFAIMSSSSWGCELKYSYIPSVTPTGRHPLREDVSWNFTDAASSSMNIVILFVRMWVEMMIQKKKERKMSGHPLREDVSWNVRSCI